MTQVMDILINLASIVMCIFVCYLAYLVCKYLKSKMNESDYETLDKISEIVLNLVTASQDSSFDSVEERKQYIEESLADSGYTVTKAIEILIEAYLANYTTTYTEDDESEPAEELDNSDEIEDFTYSEGTFEETVEVLESAEEAVSEESDESTDEKYL